RLRRFDPVTLEAAPSFPIVSGFDATINSIAELPGRGYLVSGPFNAIGGTPVSRVALITYGGVVDPDYGAGMNLTPHEMIAGVDGTAYIRGNFGGTPYRRFIRLDRRGQVVTDFPAFTEIVEFMRRPDDGRLFLLTNTNGNRTVVILQPSGLPDPAYPPAGTFDEQINAVAEQPDGKLILVGEFTEFAGEPARGHIRLLPSG